MGYAVRLPNGIVSMVEVDFQCPKCSCPHGEDFWYKTYIKSNKGFIYKQCKGCKTKLGITTCMTGDVKVWLKEDEKNKR